MAMNRLIEIQKLNLETEKWQSYYKCYAEVNKSSGREYFNAKTNITQNTFNFKVRYLRQLEETIFNSNQYRIVYKNNIFNIINVDDKKEKRLQITFVANCINV